MSSVFFRLVSVFVCLCVLGTSVWISQRWQRSLITGQHTPVLAQKSSAKCSCQSAAGLGGSACLTPRGLNSGDC